MARRPPLPREPLEATIDGFTHGGEGVARVEGKAVFVPGTIPGERIVLRVTDDRKNWARARLVEVLTPAADRVTPPCPYVPDCGGCDLQHVTPDGQRRLKTRVVIEQLERLGHLSHPPVEPCRPVGPDTGYRTHARLHAADDGRLGFHRAGTTEVVPIETCLVLTEFAQSVRDEVGDASGAAEVEVRAHPPVAEDATLSRAAVLHPGPGPLQVPDGTVDIALAQPDGTTIAMRGEGELAAAVDTPLGRFTYAFDASSFFQVSEAGAAAIVAEVLDAAGDVDGALVWDLYAGVGLLSLPLAAAGADVLAVEGHARSAAWLSRNAEAAGLAIAVEATDVRDHVASAAAHAEAPEVERGSEPDVVVLDPPRVGAGEGVCEAVAALRPAAIVYVACDPAALARDARTLADAGYHLRRAVPLDLFPMTHHVEVVAAFTSASAP